MERLSDNDICIKLAAADSKAANDNHLNKTEALINHMAESEAMTRNNKKSEESLNKSDVEDTLEENEFQEEDTDAEIQHEEKMSLLEGKRTQPVIQPSANVQLPPDGLKPDARDNSISLSVVPVATNPGKATTFHPDIQLAEVEAVSEFSGGKQRRSSLSSYWLDRLQLSSIQTLCGPKPGRLTVICLVLLSVWAAAMLLVHLNKKIDSLSLSLTETQTMIKSLEDLNIEFRLYSQERIKKVNNKITKVLGVLSKGKGGPRRDSISVTTPDPPTTQSNLTTQSAGMDDPMFEDGWWTT